MRKFVTWLFWTVYYAVRPVPRSLEGYLLRGTRRRWPWWKFKPSVWHNDDGRQWHICFREEESFRDQRDVTVWCEIGQESGDIVGLVVWDKMLTAKAGGDDVSSVRQR